MKFWTDVQGQVVMITGGGGSIGSELCRQIARHNPKQLIIVDIYENNAYEIQQELRRSYGDKPGSSVALIGSVRDAGRLDQAVRPAIARNIVFHAAAHKHVPLMETAAPARRCKNNVFGTLRTWPWRPANTAAGKFVMICTDKAVEPDQCHGRHQAALRAHHPVPWSRRSDTTFVAVRFGNVLGCNGSVIPLFKKQIAGRRPGDRDPS